MAVLEISVVPVGTHDTSLSGHLAGIPKVLRESGLRYEIHPMGTVVEGPTEDLFSLAARLHRAGFERGARRVSTHFLLDDRRALDALAGLRSGGLVGVPGCAPGDYERTAVIPQYVGHGDIWSGSVQSP